MGCRRRMLGVLIAGVMIVTACSDDGGTSPTTTSPRATTTVAPATTAGPTGSTRPGTDSGTGSSLIAAGSLRLTEGRPQTAGTAPIAVVDGTPIDDGAIAAVLARLPDWVVDEALATPFAWPAETLPAPLAGATVDGQFPPAEGPPVVEVPDGPLHVLRHQPDGDVTIAPFVSITFDQPMVPVSTVGQLADADVPATITPDLAGTWQWIGTRTLRFDVDTDVPAGGIDRLPMATTFTVEVPAGTRSASGSELAETVSWQFATPPVTVRSFGPSDDDSLPLEPIFVAGFDQLVDPAAILAVTTVTANDQLREMRLASAAEIEADPIASAMTSSWPDGRWVAFRPVAPFEPDAALRIEIGPNAPSAEGPRTADTSSTYRARTYAPLRVGPITCGWGDRCRPGSSIEIAMNNPLDTAVFDPSSIRVEPPIDGMAVGASGAGISIYGAAAGSTTYTVTIPAGLTDVFGQRLGSDEERSITFGEAAPMLQQFNQPMITVDPSAERPAISVVSTNHDQLRVRAFAVRPDDWTAFDDWFTRRTYREGEPQAPPFVEVVDRIVDVDGDQDRVTETAIDLGEAFPLGAGHAVVIVETVESYGEDTELFWMNQPAIAWVQATALGVDAFADDDELRAWVTDLSTGTPRPGATVRLAGAAATAVTDADGLATIALPSSPAAILTVTAGNDVAMIANRFYGGGGWTASIVSDAALFHVLDDRQVYRPGETVSIAGWARRSAQSTDGRLVLFGSGATIEYVARDSSGNEIASGRAELNPLGGFDFTFDVPAGANLGHAWLEIVLTGVSGIPGGSTGHQFRIEEFRRPEFEVAARPESQGPAAVGESLTVAVDANYYAGGPLAASPVDWRVTTSPATYSPPGWEDFSFGRWTPWWYDDHGDASDPVCCWDEPYGDSDVATYSGITDAAGTHYLQIDVPRLEGDLDEQPVTVTAQADVTDVNRQSLASTTSVLVHPSTRYVGLASERTFVREGEPLDVDVIVADIDGAAIAGVPVRVTASRSTTMFRNGAWVDVPADVQTCDVTSAASAVACSFSTATGGSYTIAADVTDEAGRGNHSELTRWVTGGDAVPARNVEQEQLTIVPDLAEYEPGSSAELLVQSPVSTGAGLAVVTRNGIHSTIRFQLVDGSAVVSVPIGDEDVPQLGVHVEVVGSSERIADDGTPLADAPRRPAFAVGTITLPISLASRTLAVEITPPSAPVLPGEDTAVDVTVRDPDGRPVEGAELAVVVVDEAVLALSGYQLGDPLASFYGQLPTYLSTSYGRASIVLADPAALQDGGDRTGTASTDAPAATMPTDASEDSAGGGEQPVAAADGDSAGVAPATGTIGVRTNFDALAVFQPDVRTGADGTARIDVPLPDNLTRYRVMVVAVHGDDRFGSAESNITARLPLMVRPSAPRFLNFGDVFELPIVVQNQTSAPMEVDVVLQTDNLDVTGPAGVRVSVPANDRVEVRFPVAAASVGTARFRVAAVSGDAADAATVDLPVYTPATAEAFATYGVVDDGATAQPISPPTDVIPQFGGLEITTSSTSLQTLTDAVLYLTEYDYRSTDALASRIMAIASLRDVLDAFDADGLPSPAESSARVQADVDGLAQMQNGDGGFGFWRRGVASDPYNSVQVLHALEIAAANGFDVPDGTLSTARTFARDVEQYIPSHYGPEARAGVIAYALHVRMLSGDRDATRAEDLHRSYDGDLPLDALAWLWPVVDDAALVDEIARTFANRAVDTAGAATFTTEANDDDHLVLRSDRRTDGIVLDALIAMRPDSDLVPKVVNGLLGNRNAGRWDSVQENSFILLALHRYFETFEAQTPDFVARVWLGGQFAGDHAFVGRSTDRARITIPTATLIGLGDGDLVIGKDGAGRLYYRIGLRTAPADLSLDPLDRGFVVTRTYEGVDDPADVVRDADGVWHIRAGARVRVRLTMVAESQRTHAALVDPLPAGLEILNPTLATSADVPEDESGTDGSGPDWWWYGTWYDHQNMRDDRAEAFATWLPAGTYDYSYVATATTPGTFVAPPTRAEEMYAPETFGRGSSDTVVVED